MCSFHISEIRRATISPHAYAAHPTEADKPEECSLPLMRFVCRILHIFGMQYFLLKATNQLPPSLSEVLLRDDDNLHSEWSRGIWNSVCLSGWMTPLKLNDPLKLNYPFSIWMTPCQSEWLPVNLNDSLSIWMTPSQSESPPLNLNLPSQSQSPPLNLNHLSQSQSPPLKLNDFLSIWMNPFQAEWSPLKLNDPLKAEWLSLKLNDPFSSWMTPSSWITPS